MPASDSESESVSADTLGENLSIETFDGATGPTRILELDVDDPVSLAVERDTTGYTAYWITERSLSNIIDALTTHLAVAGDADATAFFTGDRTDPDGDYQQASFETLRSDDRFPADCTLFSVSHDGAQIVWDEAASATGKNTLTVTAPLADHTVFRTLFAGVTDDVLSPDLQTAYQDVVVDFIGEDTTADA